MVHQRIRQAQPQTQGPNTYESTERAPTQSLKMAQRIREGILLSAVAPGCHTYNACTLPGQLDASRPTPAGLSVQLLCRTRSWWREARYRKELVQKAVPYGVVVEGGNGTGRSLSRLVAATCRPHATHAGHTHGSGIAGLHHHDKDGQVIGLFSPRSVQDCCCCTMSCQVMLHMHWQKSMAAVELMERIDRSASCKRSHTGPVPAACLQ